MKRLLAALSVLAVVAIAAWTYDINYRTKNALREVDRLRAEIAMQHETRQVLRVEWAYLNRPERLKRLVQMHDDRLHLVPIGPDRFGDVASVPFPPPPEMDPVAAALAAATAAGAFIPPPVTTGVSAAAAAAERLDGGMAFFPVMLAAGAAAESEPLAAPAIKQASMDATAAPAERRDGGAGARDAEAGAPAPAVGMAAEPAVAALAETPAPDGPVAPVPPRRPGALP